MKIIISNIHLTDDEEYIEKATKAFNKIKDIIEKNVMDNNLIIIFQLAIPHNFFTYKIEQCISEVNLNKIIESLPEELALWIR